MKRYSIDGLPGYTMQGKKGKTGERGCMTFCNVMNAYNITKNYNYSIGIFIDENDVMTPIVFPSNKVMPIKGDYVIDVLQSISNLYVIDNVIDFSKENLLNESSSSDDSGLTEDELFRTNVINTIYDSVEGFEEFVESLTNNDVYYVFTLSFINSWTFKQGLSSKDMDFSVAMQSFPIYRTPWKGEYTPKYLSKEITYVSSPYTPFAHIKTKNLVEDNQASLQKLPQKEQVDGGLFATWPGVYRNIANLASYYTDIFEFDIDAFGYVFKKDTESSLNIDPWLNITDCTPGERYENIDNFSGFPCFSAVVNKNGSYTPKDRNIFELLSVTNINDAEKEIIKILNNEKTQENISSSDYQKAEEVKSFIGDKVLLIQKDRSAGKNTSADNHYLSFLKVNLYSSTKINSDEEENNDSVENNESTNQYEDAKTTQSRCVINTKKVDMKSDGTLAQYKITYVGDDIEFLHDPITIGSTKKINATIFLGKNHFNLNQVNIADKVINTSYHCKNISHENTGNKDSYTFNDYEINVYDVNKMEINSFERSDEAQMNRRDFRINNVTAPVLKFKEWDFCFVSNGVSATQTSWSQRRSQELSTTETISGNKYSFKYLDFLFNNNRVISNNNFNDYIDTPDNTTYELFNPNSGKADGDLNTNNLLFSIETRVTEKAETIDNTTVSYNEYQVVKFPLTLNNLYIGFHIIKLDTNSPYTNNTTSIQVGNVNYTQIPYIENHNDSEFYNETKFSVISKKLYSLGSFNNNNQDVDDLEEQPLISLETVSNTRKVNTYTITSNLGKLDADYYIVPCLYAKICSKIKNNETYEYEYNDETSSLKLICESDKIFSIKDLYLLFAQEENVDIPFEFLCNINTFTNARYYIDNSFQLCIPNDMMADDSVNNINIAETRAFMETPSEDTDGSETAFTKNISYTNITQCIKVNNLETDETGSINIPIISTKPTIHTNNSKNDKEQENVFAYIVIEYSNNSLMDKAYLEYPFFASRTIIDKIFFSQQTQSLNCYLLPRKFYLNNKNITNITGASFDQSNTELDYIIYQEASNYYWNEYITPSDLINDRTSYAESSGEIPLGGLFKAINGNILYYDSDDPTLQESSQRFKKYNILTNTFDDYEEGEEYDKEDPENKIDNVEELIDYHESLNVEAENYALTQFVVYSSLKPELLKNVKIEIELFNNTNMNIKNVCTCVDNMWETTKYTDSIKFNYNNDTTYYLPRKHMLDIMQDLYMGAVHNAPSVITEKTGNYPYVNVNTLGYKNNARVSLYQKSLIYRKHDEYLSVSNDSGAQAAANRLQTFDTKLNNYGDENILKYAYTSKTDEISEITPDTEFIYSRVGWSKNYDNTLNFDKENIFPCTLVIKDYNNKTENGTYASSIMIPKDLADNCSMKIYAYIKNSSSSATKILIGETSMDKTY